MHCGARWCCTRSSPAESATSRPAAVRPHANLRHIQRDSGESDRQTHQSATGLSSAQKAPSRSEEPPVSWGFQIPDWQDASPQLGQTRSRRQVPSRSLNFHGRAGCHGARQRPHELRGVTSAGVNGRPSSMDPPRATSPGNCHQAKEWAGSQRESWQCWRRCGRTSPRRRHPPRRWRAATPAGTPPHRWRDPARRLDHRRRAQVSSLRPGRPLIVGSAHLVCLLAADAGGSSRRISASQSSAMRARLVHLCSSSSQWARRSRSCSAAEGRIDPPQEQQHDKHQHSRDRSPHHRDPPSRAYGPTARRRPDGPRQHITLHSHCVPVG